MVVTATVARLPAAPVFTRAPIPGMAVTERFANPARPPGRALVTISLATLMHPPVTSPSAWLISTVTCWRLRPVIIALGAALVLSAPVTLIDPDGSTAS